MLISYDNSRSNNSNNCYGNIMASPCKSAMRSKANSLKNTYVRVSERSSNSSKVEEYGNGGRVITEESEQSADQ